MNTPPERLQVVDNDDNPIGVATREEAWKKALNLRHAHIVLRDSEGNYLLQQRSAQKKSNPLKWTLSATGHVDEGESYEQAAARELKEEIGVETDLSLMVKFFESHPNEYGTWSGFISVFVGIISHDTIFNLQEEEVAKAEWFSKETILANLKNVPHQYTEAAYSVLKKIL